MKRTLNVRKEKVKAPTKVKNSARQLLAWYDRHRRVMPWRALPRERRDPYRIWVSEMMLQQTTVAAVVPYFQKFIARWPTVQTLAAAKREDVLRMWAGLGYYRRAHLMHECAKVVCREYGGVFPRSEETLLSLPGIGPYTAAVVVAIAYDQRANVVDGNVERVMARILACEIPLPRAKASLRHAAMDFLPKTRFGDYAQALMDLGAIVCTPKNPKCDLCPWMKGCQANKLGIAEELPRRFRAQTKPVRSAVAFVAMKGADQILLRQRKTGGLLGGMMEVPSSPWQVDGTLTLAEAISYAPMKTAWVLLPGTVQHVFSHFKLVVRVALAVSDTLSCRKADAKWVALREWESEALPSLMRKIVRFALDSL